MFVKQPRKIDFAYHATNHKNEGVNLNFSFNQGQTYQEDLKLFIELLDQAKADVESELKQ
jgi:hypothetical protein